MSDPAAVVQALRLPSLLESPAQAPVTVCSVAGSLLSQAVLTAVSAKGSPIESIVMFSGEDYVARSVELNSFSK